MKKTMQVILTMAVFFVLFQCEKDTAKSPQNSTQDDLTAHFKSLAPLPEAPEGYEWVIDSRFSDDFEGDALDLTKWNDHHPFWQGRPPAKFMPEAVSVADGNLKIQAGVLEPAEGEFTLQGGAVTSKSEQAHFGYYECRMKASKISMSSTFWMSSRKLGDGYPKISQEVDIVEAIGGAQRWEGFKTHMKSNTHVRVVHNAGEREVFYSKGGETPLDVNAGEDYHTFGAWWVDANTIKFYYNGEHRFTIQPDTSQTKIPMANPMWINMVVETYDWEVPPTRAQGLAPMLNTTYYDWVRAFVLKPEE